MKNLPKAIILSTLGLISMASCGSNNQEGNKETTDTTTSSSTGKKEENRITIKKKTGYIDGINNTLDLAGFYEFKGETSIDDLVFSHYGEGSENYVEIDGHTVKSLGYGKANIYGEVREDRFINSSTANLYINVINKNDIVSSYTSSYEGISLSMNIKSDSTFALTRSGGEVQENNISAATITGSYSLEDDGFFHFSPDEGSSSYATNFKGELNYSKIDGSEYTLSALVPISASETDSPLLVSFKVAK